MGKEKTDRGKRQYVKQLTHEHLFPFISIRKNRITLLDAFIWSNSTDVDRRYFPRFWSTTHLLLCILFFVWILEFSFRIHFNFICIFLFLSLRTNQANDRKRKWQFVRLLLFFFSSNFCQKCQHLQMDCNFNGKLVCRWLVWKPRNRKKEKGKRTFVVLYYLDWIAICIIDDSWTIKSSNQSIKYTKRIIIYLFSVIRKSLSNTMKHNSILSTFENK